MSYWVETGLKNLENFDFLQSCPKIGIFALKRAKRPPGTHWDPPGWQKLFFWVARIWKSHGRRKNFWIISHRKKVGLTIPSTWRPFWISGRVELVAKIFFWGTVLNQRGQCPGPFTTKKRLQWGGGCTRGVLGCLSMSTNVNNFIDNIFNFINSIGFLLKNKFLTKSTNKLNSMK